MLVKELVDPLVIQLTEQKAKYESGDKLNLPDSVTFSDYVVSTKNAIVASFACDIAKSLWGELAPMLTYFRDDFGIGVDSLKQLTEAVEERFKIAGF